MADRLLVLGAGGHAKVVVDAALASGWDVVGLLDADPSRAGQKLLDRPIFACDEYGASELCAAHAAQIVVAIGQNETRRRIFELLRAKGAPIATIVHPRACVASSCSIAAGTVVFAGVVVNPDTRIGANVILNTSSSIDHDGVIGDHAHVSPGVHVGGTVSVGEGTHIGIGATLRNDIRVGSWCLVGAGSVVVESLPDRVVAFGVPARVRRDHAVKS
jgi:sugar O-acyltransferase (sialic acid O-acetyltransferase NeuD family)